MTKRKIFLIAADVILLCVCIFQWVLGSRNNIKNFVLSETPDEIIITNPEETISIVQSGDEWFVGELKYPASKSVVDSLISGLSSIKALDKVGDASKESALVKYDLDAEKRICVEAKKNGTVIRTLYLGKEAAAGSQCYATIDQGKNIYILSGNARLTFDKTIARIRSNGVIDLDKSLITSVTLAPVDGDSWTLSRTNNGTDFAYTISGADVELDTQKAADFIESFCALTTNNWYGEKTDLGGQKKVDVIIICDGKTVTLEVYEIPGTEESQNLPLYYGNSSETPYTFNIGNYSAARYLSKPEEIAK